MPGSWAFSLEYRLQPARVQYTLKAEHLPRSVPTAHVPKNRSIRFADRNEPLRIGSEGHGGDRTARSRAIRALRPGSKKRLAARADLSMTSSARRQSKLRK